jgi:hypothetical protein
MSVDLPKSRDEARTAALYDMNFKMCCYCGHVFNLDFDYTKIPYEENSYFMFNSGTGWITHLEDTARLLRQAYRAWGKTIIDIGAGDGGFLNIINRDSLDEGIGTRCIAFEPGIESESCRQCGLEVYVDYFVPQRDIKRFKPDILICRHVLEHMQNPRDFVAEIAYYANIYNCFPVFLTEVPSITKALETHRITDFLYEHVSNFTQKSLRTMFESVGWVTHDEFLAYNNEVAIWIGQPQVQNDFISYAQLAKQFRNHTWDSIISVRSGLEQRRKAGLSIAFWGGTGKSAAFLNAYRLDGDRVVDSDLMKVGYFVPGLGQKIEHSNSLINNPVDIIIITTRWRAADIYAEIKQKGIKYNELLYLDGSYLRQYTEENYDKEI